MAMISSIEFEPDPCEWCPKEGRPAHMGDEVHGDATVSVGPNGEWHLCATCAALPAFDHFTERKPLPRDEATV
jgi:hypothetical protein